MSIITNVISLLKEKSARREKLKAFKELTKIINQINLNKISNDNFESFSFPDYRWLRADEPKHKWIQWRINGHFCEYNIVIDHQVRGSLVTIKKGEELICSYVDDTIHHSFGLGCQDIVGMEHDEIQNVLRQLKVVI